MQKLLTLTVMLALVGSTMAFDLGSERPPKPETTCPKNIPNPDRQGGDTILDAVYIEIPVVDMTGSTVGYTDDYDEICPYGGMAPDVVYTFTPTTDIAVDIDMLGSTYDTKIYVYDADLMLIACNDDYYPDYVSKLENVPLIGGTQYFLVIDGYGTAAGDYVLNITEFEPCVLTCPAGATLEGEPSLVDGYEDAYNGGCDSPEFGVPFGVIYTPIFCGVSGWYISSMGLNARDTDWYELIVPYVGYIEIVGDAEYPTHLFELGPQDCNSVVILQAVTVGSCSEGTMTVFGVPGEAIWFWVGPTAFEGPVNEYNYVLYFNPTVATEAHSWANVKAIFD